MFDPDMTKAVQVTLDTGTLTSFGDGTTLIANTENSGEDVAVFFTDTNYLSKTPGNQLVCGGVGGELTCTAGPNVLLYTCSNDPTLYIGTTPFPDYDYLGDCETLTFKVVNPDGSPVNVCTS